MSLQYIRDCYRVPAVLGAGIRLTNLRAVELGRITGSRGQYLIVDFGRTHPEVLHPTWQVEYLSTRVEADSGPLLCEGLNATEACSGSSSPKRALWCIDGRLLCGTCHRVVVTPGRIPSDRWTKWWGEFDEDGHFVASKCRTKTETVDDAWLIFQRDVHGRAKRRAAGWTVRGVTEREHRALTRDARESEREGN